MQIIEALSAGGTEGRTSDQGQTFGYLRTDGGDLRDVQTGEVVRLVGANWHGAEGEPRVPNGLWARNYMDMMDQMVDAGLNSIRVPISPAILWDAPVTESIDYSRNPSLKGLSAIEVMDEIVDYAGKIGLRIVFDMHRRDPGVGKQEDGLWYDEDYSLQDLAGDWQTIAARYKGDPTVVGFDLFNEPSGRGETRAHWGERDGHGPSDWAAAAEVLGNAILDENPQALIFVEGVHIYKDKWYWVGGNLKGAGDRPIELDVDGRLVYSPHDYPYSVQHVPWLEDAGAGQMRRLFDEHWGYLEDRDIAPIVIGETGSRLRTAADELYMDTLVAYLEATHDASPKGQGGVGLWWWSWNPNSGDTGGLLRDDWSTLIPEKLDYIERVAGEMLPTNVGAAASLAGDTLVFELEMAHNSDRERTYHYSIDSGTAKAGRDFVAKEGTVVFAAGETRATIETAILPDNIREGDETAILRLDYASGKSLATIVGTISDTPPGAAKDPKPDPKDGGGSGGGGGSDAPLDRPITAPAEADARQTLHSEGRRIDVAVEGDAASGFEVTTLITHKRGDALGDWSLRVDPTITDMLHIGAVKGGTLDRREGGAVRIDAWGSGTQDDQAVVGFDVSVLAKMGAGPMGVDWKARGPLGGQGTAHATGTDTDSGGLLDVDFQVADSWGDDTVRARIEVTNRGDTTLNDWVIELDGDGFEFDRTDVSRSVNSWDLSGGRVAVAAPNWNEELDPGETFSFSITGQRGAGAGAPLDAEALLSQLDFLLV